jgi:hypothetical protein
LEARLPPTLALPGPIIEYEAATESAPVPGFNVSAIANTLQNAQQAVERLEAGLEEAVLAARTADQTAGESARKLEALEAVVVGHRAERERHEGEKGAYFVVGAGLGGLMVQGVIDYMKRNGFR